MGTDRTWTLTSRRDDDGGLLWSICAASTAPRDTTEWIPVVEEARLREAEAERDALRTLDKDIRALIAAPDGTYTFTAVLNELNRMAGKEQAEARAERLEAELRELVTTSEGVALSASWHEPQSRRLATALARARGVLEKDTDGG